VAPRTKASIEIDVKGLKAVNDLLSKLNSIDTKVNKINKLAGPSGRQNVLDDQHRLETQIVKLQTRSQRIRNQLLGLNQKDAKVSRLKARLTRAENKAGQARFVASQRELAIAEKELSLLQKQTIEINNQAKGMNKLLQIRQGKFAGSGPGVFGPQPAPKRGFRQRLGMTQGFDTQSALISGAFPLLFGQGPIGAAAGALGGGIGGMFGGMGGFAGGIAATAVVQQIQSALDAITKLGQAMSPFAQNTEAVTAALGLQGSAEESRLRLIEQTQGKTAAFNAAMRLMANDIGQRGVDSLKQFGENTRLLASQFTLAITKIQAFAAAFANFIAKVTGLQGSLEAGAATRTVAAAAGEGNAEAQALVNRRRAAEALRGQGGQGARKKQLLDEISAEEKIFAIRRNTSIEADNLTQKFDALGVSIKAEAEETKRIAGIEKEGQLAKDNLQVEIDKLVEKQAKVGQLEEKDQIRLTTLEATRNKIDEQVDSLSDAAEATDKLNQSTKDMKSNFEKIGESIASGVSDNLTAAIMQTKTLGDAARSILNDLANTLVRLGVNTILKGIAPGFFGSLTGLGFARGGRPPVGKASVVGEKGPELFVPRRSGTIIPNDKLGGGSTNISVNVDASGSAVEGDDSQSRELGRLISVAIQSELLKQRRPGGLLR
jgi:hypothetical protein